VSIAVGPMANLKSPYFQPSLSVRLSVSDLHFYPSALTDFDETWSQGPYSDLVWRDHNGPHRLQRDRAMPF